MFAVHTICVPSARTHAGLGIVFQLGLLMGDLLTHDDYGAEWYEVMLSFMIMWLTWHHANMFLSRFKLEKPWDILLFAMMVSRQAQEVLNKY